MQKTVGQSSCYLNAQPRSPSSPLEFVPTVSSSCSFAQHSLCLVCCVPFLLSFGLNWSRHTLQIWLLCAGRELKHFVTLQVQLLEQNTTSLKNEAIFNLFRFETEISKLKSEGLLKSQQCEVQMVSQSIVHEIVDALQVCRKMNILSASLSVFYVSGTQARTHSHSHTHTNTNTRTYIHTHTHAHTRWHTY